MMEHVIQIGVRQGRDRRKTFDEALKVGNNSLHLRLLQHDLRYPDAIGVRALLPWKIFAAGDVIPGEKPA